MEEQKRTFIQKLGDVLMNRNVTKFVRSEVPKPTIPTPSQIAWAIKQNETGGVKTDPYKFYKPSGIESLGNDLGAYQVTEGELKTYSPRYLGGQNINANDFLTSSTAQDKYIDNKIKYYLDKGYTPEDIADIHRSGYTKSFPPGSGKYQSPKYVESFKKFLQATTTKAVRP
jgi:hypothetical protein